MNNSIISGDCNLILPTFKEESIDLILTDPPYGINYKSHKQNYDTRKGTVKKERPEFFDYIIGDYEIPVKWLKEAYRILKNNSAIYIFCHWTKWNVLYSAVLQAGFNCKNMIVLNKNNHGMGDLSGQFAPKHELLLFATKGRHILKFKEKRLNDVWDVKVKYSGAKRFHPNEKPLEWLAPCIINSSNEKDIVLDPFAGSGSTGVVAKSLNRNYILIELDNKFIPIINVRLAP
jgi:site-specific DNA-methyltransferase (adenine-specific)